MKLHIAQRYLISFGISLTCQTFCLGTASKLPGHCSPYSMITAGVDRANSTHCIVHIIMVECGLQPFFLLNFESTVGLGS